MNKKLLAGLTLSLFSTLASAHLFNEIDTSKDGMIDESEFKAHDMRDHEQHMKMHDAHMKAHEEHMNVHEQHMSEHEGMEGGMGHHGKGHHDKGHDGMGHHGKDKDHAMESMQPAPAPAPVP